MHTAISSDIAAQLIALLAALSWWCNCSWSCSAMLLRASSLRLQSLFLPGIAAVVAYFHGAVHVSRVVLTSSARCCPATGCSTAGAADAHRPGDRAAGQFPTSMLGLRRIDLAQHIVARPFPSLDRLGNNTWRSPSRSCSPAFSVINRLKGHHPGARLLTVENGGDARRRRAHDLRHALVVEWASSST